MIETKEQRDKRVKAEAKDRAKRARQYEEKMQAPPLPILIPATFNKGDAMNVEQRFNWRNEQAEKKDEPK